MSVYVLNVRCNNCSAILDKGMPADFYNRFTSFVCWRCGHHGFYDKVERWASESVWWRTSTWGKGHWEPLTDVNLEPKKKSDDWC